jgi:hypothetical protein
VQRAKNVKKFLTKTYRTEIHINKVLVIPEILDVTINNSNKVSGSVNATAGFEQKKRLNFRIRMLNQVIESANA